MDIFVTLVIVIIIIFFVYLLFHLKPMPQKVKKSSTKKDEIIENYKKRLKKELSIFRNSPEKLTKYKVAILKDISKELSRNIYFDKSEIKNIIKELASVEI